MGRVIFHVDQNCYFASVEMISHPEYRDVPMAVVGDKDKRHGIILAKNIHASGFGVKTAEVIWQAKLKCPGLVLAPAHYEKYTFYSSRLRELYLEYTDRVEPFGLDECWLDMTEHLGGRDPVSVADEIRMRVREEFGLTCSVGVSFNKIFAKLGSDYKKPDATTLITEDGFRDIVWPLPCSDLLFVGRKTSERLKKVNIRTIGDLAGTDPKFLEHYLGKNGIGLWLHANGRDDSEVREADYVRTVRSVGNSTTPPADLTDKNEVSATFHALADKVAGRLRKHGLKGSVVSISVRDRELRSYEKQKILYRPTDVSGDIYKASMELFESSYDWHSGIRSIGIRLSDLTESDAPEQISIFDDEDKLIRDKLLDQTLDRIRARYGDDSVISCAQLRHGEKDEDRMSH